MTDLRQPIVSLLGHVDHGKTTLLDRITGATRAAHEAGGITQHIGAFEVPRQTLLRLSHGLLPPEQVAIPGFLMIDTPGHRSFELMRRRGGALADLAVLVVDVNEGVMPQTRESVQILRREKTPFAVALTKMDLVPGWREPAAHASLKTQLQRCGAEYETALDTHLYSVVEELLRLDFSSERYDRVSDFTHNVGIVPVSAKSGVGVAELVALVVGLSQRFLEKELALVDAVGEGTVLERSEQRGLGPVASVIVYRGRLHVGDEIVITGTSGPFSSRIRGLYRPPPTATRRVAASKRLQSATEVSAAAGVFVVAPEVDKALPGGLIKVVRSPEERAAVLSELAREAQPVAELAESGVALAADTLGGLEALAFECRAATIPVHVAEIGPVNRPMVLRMADVQDATHRAVLAFNVPVLPDAVPESLRDQVRVFSGEVIYQLLEAYGKWREERQRVLDVELRQEIVHPAKLKILPGFVFRRSKPAVVGIRVLSGQLRPGVRLMSIRGEEVGLLRSLQRENESVKEAEEGAELAASIEGATVGRTLLEGDVLYVTIPESSARALRDRPLSDTERAVLDEVLKIRRATQPFWGQ
ncbi:MAG: translation initiation factor IF-2 [Thermoplasmata archaeon]|nr:translation initiation factor IF-2 [Thermoplasmata archaeon]